MTTEPCQAPTGWMEKGKMSATPLRVNCKVSMLHQTQDVSCCLLSCFAESCCPSALLSIESHLRGHNRTMKNFLYLKLKKKTKKMKSYEKY